MSWRAMIANVLDGIEGLTPHAIPPQVISPGDAWPVWRGARPASYCGLEQRWELLVALPNPELAATIEGADPLVDVVTARLVEIADVSLVEPGAMPVTAADAAVGRAASQPIPILRWTLSTVGTGEDQ